MSFRSPGENQLAENYIITAITDTAHCIGLDVYRVCVRCVCVCRVCVCAVCVLHSLVAVVVEAIVAAQSCEGPKTNSIREEDLGSSINPYLTHGHHHHHHHHNSNTDIFIIKIQLQIHTFFRHTLIKNVFPLYTKL